MLKEYLGKFYNRFPYLKFPIKLFSVFLPLQLVYLSVISASHPDGKLYSPFVIRYLNIIEWLRSLILFGSEKLLSLAGFEAIRTGPQGLHVTGGGTVNLNNACLGFAIISFWIAFIYANSEPLRFRVKWLLFGIVFICVLNVIRVTTLLYALNKKWKAIVNIDHHSLFNVVAYIFIFILIFFYIRASKSRVGVNTKYQ